MTQESVRMLLEDLKAMPPDHEVFRTPGIRPYTDWLGWAESVQRYLQTPPRKDVGLPAIR
jgi:hypothetical protein